jgi:signal transduction histidine kinase
MQQANMQQAKETIDRRTEIERHTELEGEHKRAQTVLETLATLRSQGESLSEVAHDARNMVTALGLYCDLLEEPGVLSVPFLHYGQELRLVAAASRRLVEKLMALDPIGLDSLAFDRADLDRQTLNLSALDRAVPDRQAGVDPYAPKLAGSRDPRSQDTGRRDPGIETHRRLPFPSPEPGADSGLNAAPAVQSRQDRARRWDLVPGEPIANLAAELMANRNLLAALAGTAIILTVDTTGGALPVHLTGEDLTRVLVNLVKNSCEAMAEGGRIRISLYEEPAVRGSATSLSLAIEDNGPGIPTETLESIFTSGYTTRGRAEAGGAGWPHSHRGLGLAITRSIVESAGGRISALNREMGGARFEIELPVRVT